MAYEIFLARFEDPPEGEETLKVLRRLRKKVARILPEDNPMYDLGEIEESSFVIQLPEGEATAHADHIAFRLQELRSETIPIVYQLAVAGEMVIVNEGAGPHIIL
ncbi:MAG TPA: hypothetical protein VGP94_00555, partial [Tepidisphaeraceae bacterium]|nr:hypothetical protein [Tepidisphaeraceae bacterium]